MDVAKAELGYVQLFYKNSTVFLTGATEFVGKLLLEKILRSLPVKKVYVLIDRQNEADAETILQKLLESSAFDRLRRIDQNFHEKITCIPGDCALPNLGMSDENKELITNEVDCIFHCADTTNPDETISSATFINVRATRDLINIAKNIKKLKIFVHMSTVFANAPNIEIQEKVYKPAIAYANLIEMCETVDTTILQNITSNITGQYPNVYLLTKQVAEDVVKNEAKNIPSCIVRPSIILAANEEPLTGLIENVNDAIGTTMMQSLGIERIAYRKNENIIDIVPADFVVNHMLAAGWFVGEAFKKNKNKDTDVEVFNMISSQDNPINVGELDNIVVTESDAIPSKRMVWYPVVCFTSCYYNFVLWKFLLHTLPAYFLDYIIKLFDKQPYFVDMYNQFHKLTESLDYFRQQELYVTNENTKRILKRMSFGDRELFNFDVQTLSWCSYVQQYLKGIRVYILKDNMATIKEAQKRKDSLRVCYISCIAIVITLVYLISKFLLFRIVPRIISV